MFIKMNHWDGFKFLSLLKHVFHHSLGGDFLCSLAWTGGIFLALGLFKDDPGEELFSFSSLLLDFLRVFLLELANWSAPARFSSPLLELLELESEVLPLGLGLGLAPASEAGRSKTRSGVCFCFCWMATLWFQKSRLDLK